MWKYNYLPLRTKYDELYHAWPKGYKKDPITLEPVGYISKDSMYNDKNKNISYYNTFSNDKNTYKITQNSNINSPKVTNYSKAGKQKIDDYYSSVSYSTLTGIKEKDSTIKAQNKVQTILEKQKDIPNQIQNKQSEVKQKPEPVQNKQPEVKSNHESQKVEQPKQNQQPKVQNNQSNKNNGIEDLQNLKNALNEASRGVNTYADVVSKRPTSPRPRLDLSKMSDDELRSRIDRENLEIRYNSLFSPPTKEEIGKKKTEEKLRKAGNVLTLGTSAVTLAILIKQLRDK